MELINKDIENKFDVGDEYILLEFIEFDRKKK